MNEIGNKDIVGMLLKSCDTIIESEPYLTKIDNIIGDGDHGQGMERGFRALKAMLQEANAGNCRELLRECGIALLKAMGGASGVLFATIFISGAQTLGDKTSISSADIAEFFKVGIESVMRRGGAKPGDKTMVDALVPAAQAMEKNKDKTIEELFTAAWEAARDGAEATGQMRAKKGRAKWYLDRTVGVVDPGSVSVSLMFKGMKEYFVPSEA